MELTDPKLLEALLVSVETSMEPRTRGRGAKRSKTSRPAKSQTSANVRNCQCGKCKNCADEARWELIFQTKFADPNYYNSRPVRRESSLYCVR